MLHKCETRYFLHDPINNSLEQLEHSNLEKDLVVSINNNMKSSDNCQKAIKKAMSILDMIKRNFNVIGCHTFKILYKTYVHPHLEYCIQACSSYFKKYLIETFKILTRKDNINYKTIFTLARTGHLRGSSLKEELD